MSHAGIDFNPCLSPVLGKRH